MAKYRGKTRRTDNGVAPSEADLRATGSWSLPLFGVAAVLSLVLVGTMIASGDASAFFGQ